jgi:3-methylfumaryl-CoA hydratase
VSLITDEARTWIGRKFEPREYVVTRLDIQKFALATRERDPIHFDFEAARAAGYADIVAPPSYYQVMRIAPYNIMPIDEYRPDGMSPSSEEFPPIPASRVLGGEASIEYGADVLVGDTITIHRRLTDMWEKVGRSGPLAFLLFEYELVNQRVERVAYLTYTRILVGGESSD